MKTELSSIEKLGYCLSLGLVVAPGIGFITLVVGFLL